MEIVKILTVFSLALVIKGSSSSLNSTGSLNNVTGGDLMEINEGNDVQEVLMPRPKDMGAYISPRCLNILIEMREKAVTGQSVRTRHTCIQKFQNINFSSVPFDSQFNLLAPFLCEHQLIQLLEKSLTEFKQLPWEDIYALHYRVSHIGWSAGEKLFKKLLTLHVVKNMVNIHYKPLNWPKAMLKRLDALRDEAVRARAVQAQRNYGPVQRRLVFD